MDLAYDQHAERSRRKDRSNAHLSLAPLTVKLPLSGTEDLPEGPSYYNSRSYLQGKSAPTTPRLLSRPTTPSAARSRSQHRRRPSAPLSADALTKSASSFHLTRPASGAATPRRRSRVDDGPLGLGVKDGGGAADGDWLLRTGALITSEAREFKGQSWLVSRQSSTSLAGLRGDDDDDDDGEGACERDIVASRRGSRHGSSALADDDLTSLNGSRFTSRFTSRRQSIVDGRSMVATPLYQPDGAYFDDMDAGGPDFVNLDARLEELEQDTSFEDEAAVRRLVRHGHAGKGSWISNVIGWSLFSVEEDDDDEVNDDEDGEESIGSDERPSAGADSPDGRWPVRQLIDASGGPLERIPPPSTDQGGWRDAAWLLKVASKVVF
ncbi:DUF3984 domain protein [Ophiocordyceps camponoti-floridani]|uniref:DUF3984 domain protein n=1 Tax=Ophiocordyceps camponoti-floridani TaxID=2030778 RepID=A0A8H4Q6T6_9HYPO|nr:DUF3984 domain protein [Ophiocordyceps camponoti-floridani]